MRVILWLLGLMALLVASAKDLVELDWELINAAAEGNASEVKRLIAAGAAVDGATPDGETPLHVAGISGSVDVVRILVEAGADTTSRVKSERGLQMTPLTWFVYGGHADAVRVLLDEARAPPNMIVLDERGHRITALDIAFKLKDQPTIDALRASGAKRYADLTPTDVSANLPSSIVDLDLADLHDL